MTQTELLLETQRQQAETQPFLDGSQGTSGNLVLRFYRIPRLILCFLGFPVRLLSFSEWLEVRRGGSSV